MTKKHLDLFTKILLASSIVFFQSTEGQSCPRPKLENGFFRPDKEGYVEGDRLRYRCNENYKPVAKGWWSTIRCAQGKWTHTPQCIGAFKCIPPEIPNGNVRNAKPFYDHMSTMEFECHKGFWPSRTRSSCEEGRWNPLPECIRKKEACSVPPRVEFAIIEQEYRAVFDEEEWVTYRCVDPYKRKGSRYSTCRQGNWTNPPSCEPVTSQGRKSTDSSRAEEDAQVGEENVQKENCPDPPFVENGDIITSPVQRMQQYSVTYQCANKFKLVGVPTISCTNGQWETPPTCQPNYCKLEGRIHHIGQLPAAVFIEEGKSHWFRCSSNHWYPHIEATCNNGFVQFDGCGNIWTVQSAS